MPMSDYMEVQIRTHLLRTASWTKPTVLAISLHTADPGDTTAGAAATEVPNANAYARVPRNPGDANWTAASSTDGLSDNTAVITFPAPTPGGWGTVTHVGLWDNASYGAGNLYMTGILTTAKTINGGDAAPNFPIGVLDIVFA